MTRILVRPDELLSLSSGLRQVAGQLRALGARLGHALGAVDWAVQQRAEVEAQVAAARRQAELLAGQAEQMAAFLASRAEQFRSADSQGLGEFGPVVAGFTEQVSRWLGGMLHEVGAAVESLTRLGSLAAGPAVSLAVPFLDTGVWLRSTFPGLFGGSPSQAGVGTVASPPSPGPAAGVTPLPAPVEADSFWASVGTAPVVDGRFTPGFQKWADAFNAQIEAHWQEVGDDHAGTASAKLAQTYQLTPQKVEQIWTVATANHLDPRLLLAILQQEGTGSFDTNPANTSAFGGHGPQPNWTDDLNAAVDGPIMSKLRLYPKAVEGGFKGSWVEWVNWYTPMDTDWKMGKAGVYAEDINWATGVGRAYGEVASALGSDGADPVVAYSQWLGQHPEFFKAKYIDGDFVIRPGLADGDSAPPLALWGGFPKPDFPNVTKHKDGFWWFTAPAKYCWHIERR